MSGFNGLSCVGAPSDTGFCLVQFQASGQVLSCVRPVDAAHRCLPLACMELRGPGPNRFCALGGASKARWISRSRLDGRLLLHCPRLSPRLRCRPPPRFPGGSETPEKLFFHRHPRANRSTLCKLLPHVPKIGRGGRGGWFEHPCQFGTSAQQSSSSEHHENAPADGAAWAATVAPAAAVEERAVIANPLESKCSDSRSRP